MFGQPSNQTAESFSSRSLEQVIDKFLVRLHGEYNILVKLCGNTT